MSPPITLHIAVYFCQKSVFGNEGRVLSSEIEKKLGKKLVYPSISSLHASVCGHKLREERDFANKYIHQASARCFGRPCMQ